MQFKITDKNHHRVICSVIATYHNNDPKILITKGEIMINKEGQQIGIYEADKYKIIKVPKKNK